MKILFNGLGPKDTITFNGKVFRNGSVVEMDHDFAGAYLETHLAVEIKSEDDEKEAESLQKLEVINANRRKTVKEKVEKAEDGDSLCQQDFQTQLT